MEKNQLVHSREIEGAIIFGVCAGIGRRFGFSPNYLRAILAISSIFAASGLIAYILLYLYIPPAKVINKFLFKVHIITRRLIHGSIIGVAYFYLLVMGMFVIDDYADSSVIATVWLLVWLIGLYPLFKYTPIKYALIVTAFFVAADLLEDIDLGVDIDVAEGTEGIGAEAAMAASIGNVALTEELVTNTGIGTLIESNPIVNEDLAHVVNSELNNLTNINENTPLEISVNESGIDPSIDLDRDGMDDELFPPDLDGDGINDSIDPKIDIDQDGFADNEVPADYDNDGLRDNVNDQFIDTDHDGIEDSLVPADNDGDGLRDNGLKEHISK